ncbi:MAG TPA: LysR family transcriptional regulator [Thermodesulfatator sp.]|nr:LysR family transcriptional regulator [Thermodesulfatator sp.]
MLDFRQLQVFAKVYEQRSFSRAAEEVFLTQPTVSGHIKALEDFLGVRLFDRLGREVVPTRAGEILYPYARQALSLVAEAEREIRLFLGVEKGRLEIGGSNIPGQYLLPALIGAFKENYPGLELKLLIGDTQKVAEAVARGDIELGVIGARLTSFDDLLYQPCCDDELVLAASTNQNFPEAIKLEDLERLPLIIREQGSGTRLTTEEALRERGFSLGKCRIIAEMGSTEAVKQAVKAGLGGSFISLRAIEEDLLSRRLRIIPVKGLNIRRHFYLVRHKGRSLSPPAAAFVDFLRKEQPDDQGART